MITLSSDESEEESPLTGYDDTTGFVGGMHTDDTKNVSDNNGLWRDDLIPQMLGKRMWHGCTLGNINNEVRVVVTSEMIRTVMSPASAPSVQVRMSETQQKFI